MRVLAIGAGGVGSASALLAKRRSFFEHWVVSDYDPMRVEDLLQGVADPRFTGVALDAGDQSAIEHIIIELKITHVLNVIDPRFVMPIFNACSATGAHYMDTAMSLSRPGVKLGDDQFAQEQEWLARGQLALCGMGVEPGLADVFARYASDHLFSEIDEVGIRDGANLVVDGYDFAPSFSIWTTIEECLNDPIIWEKTKGWFTTEPFSEPEFFDFPEGIGSVECVNVEHEEVVLVPRWIDCKRVTFKYGIGTEFIDVLKTLHKLGLDKTQPVNVRGTQVSPRDLVAAVLPDPATIGHLMHGKTCAGTWVTGKGKDGNPRQVYLYHVADNAWTMQEYGVQAVVWQTAMNPLVALELLATGVWAGAGVLGPEAFDAVPFLELLESAHGQKFGLREEVVGA
jgi:saccharopine dehydrogenase (NAD+, L-lysine-forming)